MRKIFLIIIGSLLVIFLFLLCFSNKSSNRRSLINTDNIELIKIGMKVEDVVTILGKPLKITNRYENKGKTFTYTEKQENKMTFPMLWVHFDKELKVDEVFAKKYFLWGMDNECIYILDSKDDNPKFMNTQQLRAAFE